MTLVQEDVHAGWSFPRLETFWQDVRYGFRMLRRQRGVTAIAILTLGLGIGANTAIFSVVHAVLLQPVPYPNADRLALIWSTWGKEGGDRLPGRNYLSCGGEAAPSRKSAGFG